VLGLNNSLQCKHSCWYELGTRDVERPANRRQTCDTRSDVTPEQNGKEQEKKTYQRIFRTRQISNKTGGNYTPRKSDQKFSTDYIFPQNTHLTAALIDGLTEFSHVFNMRECVTLRPKMAAEP